MVAGQRSHPVDPAVIHRAARGPVVAGRFAGPRTLLADPYLRHVLGFSLGQALLSTLLSLGLAIPVARALARRRFVGRTLLIKLFGLSLVLPVIIAIFGIVAVHGKQGWLPQLLRSLGQDPGNYLYGLFGILLAHVFFNMPLAARLMLQSIESIPNRAGASPASSACNQTTSSGCWSGRLFAASCRGWLVSSLCSASPASLPC